MQNRGKVIELLIENNICMLIINVNYGICDLCDDHQARDKEKGSENPNEGGGEQ